MKDCIFEYEYSLTEQELWKAVKIIDKNLNRKKLISKLTAFSLLGLMFLVSYIFSKTDMMLLFYLALICFSADALILIGSSSKTKFKGVFKIICKDKYNVQIYSNKVIIKTIEIDENDENRISAEEIEPTVISFKDDAAVYESGSSFILVNKIDGMFYTFPKKGLSEEETEKISQTFKSSLGDRYMYVI